MNRIRAEKNRTIVLTDHEREIYSKELTSVSENSTLKELRNRIFNLDFSCFIDHLPNKSIDLLFLDPPYNIDKNFDNFIFTKKTTGEYFQWMEDWFVKLLRILKQNASIYLCGDWRSSAAIQLLAEKYLIIQNRITFEREKGRGAKTNWKNCSEDIWFCTLTDKYTFNYQNVMLKRKVLAPYTFKDGKPKDWDITEDGKFRLTFPSNLWTDISIPFWSMPENTDHPTQKPEKLLAKLILASSNEGDTIFDPFAGSGTTLVTAKKLNRNFIGCEINKEYCLLTLKRLDLAKKDKTIQGYKDGVFWERNSLNNQLKKTEKRKTG